MFDVEKSTENGRIGRLEIASREIETPTNTPTSKELNYMRRSPFVSSDALEDFRIAVHVEWFDASRITKIDDEGDAFKAMMRYLRSKMSAVETRVKILHFEFGSDVEGLSEGQILRLLQMQDDLDMNSVEIPNPGLGVDYSSAIDLAAKWKKKNKVDKPLMGVVANMDTIDVILKHEERIDSCGLNFRSPRIPLLERTKEKLASRGLWIHAFSVPRSYRQVDWEGTLGILNNYYGIDSFSHYVGHPKFAQWYYLTREEMTESEKMERAQEGRFFVPLDYGTPRLLALQEKHGPDYAMSDLCKCSVCRKNTIDTMLSDYEFTYFNSRAHGNLANATESKRFRKSIENGEDKEYIDSKEYAKKIIR